MARRRFAAFHSVTQRFTRWFISLRWRRQWHVECLMDAQRMQWAESALLHGVISHAEYKRRERRWQSFWGRLWRCWKQLRRRP